MRGGHISIVGFFTSESVIFYLTLTARLLLACILGGIIGREREHMHRPAGFRTHILVCVGSALVMVTSEFIFRRYAGTANIDPARLGAQVISGIGFLGAGTIIREGFNVKGLTTAASLWAVSCVGIAAGIGFYEGAVAAAALIYITLIVLKRFDGNRSKGKIYSSVFIHSSGLQGNLAEVTGMLEKNTIEIKNIEIEKQENNEIIFKLLIRFPENETRLGILAGLQSIEGVKKVYEEQF